MRRERRVPLPDIVQAAPWHLLVDDSQLFVILAALERAPLDGDEREDAKRAVAVITAAVAHVWSLKERTGLPMY